MIGRADVVFLVFQYTSQQRSHGCVVFEHKNVFHLIKERHYGHSPLPLRAGVRVIWACLSAADARKVESAILKICSLFGQTTSPLFCRCAQPSPRPVDETFTE